MGSIYTGMRGYSLGKNYTVTFFVLSLLLKISSLLILTFFVISVKNNQLHCFTVEIYFITESFLILFGYEAFFIVCCHRHFHVVIPRIIFRFSMSGCTL